MIRGERRAIATVTLTLAAIAATIAGTTRWIARPYVVSGASMEPTLMGGDRVVVLLTAYRREPPAVGDVVLFRAPDGSDAVKRVAAVRDVPGSPAPALWVLGDNPGLSLDSRAFGALEGDRVIGRVRWRYWPPSRAGPIE